MKTSLAQSERPKHDEKLARENAQHNLRIRPTNNTHPHNTYPNSKE